MALDRDTVFTWYGHSCWEVTTPGGKTILMDPWFANPRSPKNRDQVERCDLMLVSHGHFDHMGTGDAIALAQRLGPTWPCIHEMSLYLGDLSLPGEVIGMNQGGTVVVDEISVTMVPALHSAGDREGGVDTNLELGSPVGFMVTVENGFRFYFAGDTFVTGDMRIWAEMFSPEVAILPIGGHFTMDPRAAALAVELLGVKHVLPTHYGTFPILAGTPDQLRSELGARGVEGVTVYEPHPGESVR
jgi:L-ascorbate metabolism protein UlaG (beta-lactamase superfamily)